MSSKKIMSYKLVSKVPGDNPLKPVSANDKIPSKLESIEETKQSQP